MQAVPTKDINRKQHTLGKTAKYSTFSKRPWVVVQVEDANHCDFTRLREMICTTERHYELYQREMLIMKIRVEDWNFINNNPGKIYNVHWSNLHDKEEQRREKFALRAKEKEEELENDHHTNLNKIKVMGNFLIFPLYI